MTEQPPTVREINPIPSDLDGQCAERHFLGKTIADATAMFEQDFEIYQEDLLFMGPIAFRYYLPAAMRYAESPQAKYDCYVADTMLMLIGARWRQDAADLASIRDAMASFVERLQQRIPRLDDSQPPRTEIERHCEKVLIHLRQDSHPGGDSP